jgi:hypothetical protein
VLQVPEPAKVALEGSSEVVTILAFLVMGQAGASQNHHPQWERGGRIDRHDAVYSKRHATPDYTGSNVASVSQSWRRICRSVPGMDGHTWRKVRTSSKMVGWNLRSQGEVE